MKLKKDKNLFKRIEKEVAKNISKINPRQQSEIKKGDSKKLKRIKRKQQ